MGELRWGEDRQRWGRTGGCGRDRCRLGQSETLVVGTTVAKVKVEKKGEEGVLQNGVQKGFIGLCYRPLKGPFANSQGLATLPTEDYIDLHPLPIEDHTDLHPLLIEDHKDIQHCHNARQINIQ